jgi:hypothetical protein
MKDFVNDKILTSSNGRVSLKQLSQTSFTARSAVASSGHDGLARTDVTERLRTQSYGPHVITRD